MKNHYTNNNFTHTWETLLKPVGRYRRWNVRVEFLERLLINSVLIAEINLN